MLVVIKQINEKLVVVLSSGLQFLVCVCDFNCIHDFISYKSEDEVHFYNNLFPGIRYIHQDVTMVNGSS